MTHKLEADFASWVDRILSANPVDAVAYNFNLYEHETAFAIQLVGTASFSPEDDDWACHEIFTSGEDVFEVSHAIVGETWREGHEAAKALVRAYLQSGSHAARLNTAHAVGVGFVDGDVQLVSPAGAV